MTEIATGQRRKLKTTCALVGALGVILAVSAIPWSAHAESAPSIAGLVRVHASGIGFASFSVPRAVALASTDISVDSEGATFAYVGIGEARPGDCEKGLCLRYHIRYASALAPTATDVLAPPEEMLTSGVIYVYVVTNGDILVTLHFRDLPGESFGEATGTLHAELYKLSSCTGSCGHFDYGGANRRITGSGVVGAFAYSIADPSITERPAYLGNQALVKVNACVYPTRLGESSAPNTTGYPFGCDYAHSASGYGVNTTEIVNFVAGCVGCFGQTDFRLSEADDGPAYAGYTVANADVTGHGDSGAYGFWIDSLGSD